MKTPIIERSAAFLHRHRLGISALLKGVLLGILLAQIQPLDPHVFEGHFLQRLSLKKPITLVSKKQTPKPLSTRQRRAIRRAARIALLPSGALKSLSQNTPNAPAGWAINPFQSVSYSASPAVLHSAAMEEFPAFGKAIHPVNAIPNWGAMRTPHEWNRPYAELTDSDFVPVPAYDLEVLTIPLATLASLPIDKEDIPTLTAKLYYSTRHFGKYDLDASEFSGPHPGIDLKLALGTPVGAVAGGKVRTVERTAGGLGLHVVIEHHAPDGNVFYSIYGHLAAATVAENDAVLPGQTIGTVGMTGTTTGPHLHLQIDRGEADEDHAPFTARHTPSPAEVSQHTINPIEFIEYY